MKHTATLTNVLFSLFVGFSLTTPSWRYGPFSWAPLWKFELLAGGPVQLGLLNLLPILFVFTWLVVQLRHRKWRWGPAFITVPLLLFTVWALFRLIGASFRLVFIYGGDFLIVWLVYLYYINQRPSLRPVLITVIVVQAVVGTLQFLTQGDLGLIALGELPLNPVFAGVTVLQARGEPWLRAYGLTAHPNLYGALLTMCLLLLGTSAHRLPRRMQLLLLPVAGLGLLGLFFSFSRTAWLGLLVGVVTWLLILWRGKAIRFSVSRWWILVLSVFSVIMMVVYGDLVLSRFANLDEPLEARSINQRLSDASLALQLARDHPLLGVGLGQNVNAALDISPNADRVHNVLLLAAAELGGIGLLLVLALLVAPVIAFFRRYRQGCYQNAAVGLAPWLTVVVVNQFDTTLWLTGNWQTAILFALAAGNVALRLAPITQSQTQILEPAPVDHNA